MKKTIFLLLFLFFIVVGLVLLYRNGGKIMNTNVSIAPPLVSPEPTPTPVIQTTLSFSPNPLIIASASGTLALSIDTGTNKINAVQIELSYDPNAITNVKIMQGTFFSDATQLLNSIDAKNGKASYVLVISPTGRAQSGKGTVATVAFTTKLPSGQKTNINFTPKTLVTAEDAPTSVLKATDSAEIIFVQSVNQQQTGQEEAGPFKPATGPTQ